MRRRRIDRVATDFEPFVRISEVLRVIAAVELELEFHTGTWLFKFEELTDIPLRTTVPRAARIVPRNANIH
eukprot:6168074-Pleurochrysis_carterae.AAC.1